MKSTISDSFSDVQSWLARVACMAFAVSAAADGAPRLLPFQARLTDAQGNKLADGPRVVMFQIFDSPVSGEPVWPGELHRITVNGGLINVLLGSGTPLDHINFDQPLYLQVTIDLNGDGKFTEADPPMLPRQGILPVVFAKEATNSRKLNGFDWSSILAGGATNPVAGRIDGSKLALQSIQGSQLANSTVTGAQVAKNTLTEDHFNGAIVGSNQIVAEAIGNPHLAPNAVQGRNIADATIGFSKLKPRQSHTNRVDVGGVAVSNPTSGSFVIRTTGVTQVPELAVTIRTLGGPVMAHLFTDNSATLGNGSSPYSSGSRGTMILERIDDGVVRATLGQPFGAPAGFVASYIPASAFSFFDLPEPGWHTYRISVDNDRAPFIDFGAARLVVYEF